MKKVLITEACQINGEHVEPGTELNLDIVAADSVIAAGRGQYIKPGTVRGPGNDPVVVNRDSDPVHRDPATAPAKKKAKAPKESAAGETPTPAADQASAPPAGDEVPPTE